MLLGVGCALLAGFFYSLATAIAKKTQTTTPTMMTLLQLALGAVILVPFVKFYTIQPTWVSIYFLLILGIVHTVIAFILYYQSVKNLPTTTIAAISYVDPIVAIFTDVLFYNRELDGVQMAGIVMTLVSSYFVINPGGFRKLLVY